MVKVHIWPLLNQKDKNKDFFWTVFGVKAVFTQEDELNPAGRILGILVQKFQVEIFWTKNWLKCKTSL